MACGDHGKRIVSITHGATTLGSPVGGSLSETVNFKEDRPATRKAPCTSMDEYGLRAAARFEDLITPIVRATKASLVYTVQKMDESGNVTITAINMRMGAANFDFDSPIYAENYEFAYDSGNAEDFAPITVA